MPKGPRVQWSNGPRVQRSKGPIVQRSKGPKVKGSKGLRVQGPKGPRVQRSKGPKVQRSKGPNVQSATCPNVQWYMSAHVPLAMQFCISLVCSVDMVLFAIMLTFDYIVFCCRFYLLCSHWLCSELSLYVVSAFRFFFTAHYHASRHRPTIVSTRYAEELLIYDLVPAQQPKTLTDTFN